MLRRLPMLALLALGTLNSALPAAADENLLDAAPWTAGTLLGVDQAADLAPGAPAGADLLSAYLDAGPAGARLRLSLVQVMAPGEETARLDDGTALLVLLDLAPGGTRAFPGAVGLTRADLPAGFAWDAAFTARGGDLLAGRGRLAWEEPGREAARLDAAADIRLARDTVVWRLAPGDFPDGAAARGLFDVGHEEPPRVVVLALQDGREVDRLVAEPGRDYHANCALVHHGNQSLTYTDVFHGRWDDPGGSGFDEALEVHEATGVPGNFHLSGPLQTSAHWDFLNGDPLDFNGWLADGAAAGWAGMITSAYAQHIMPFVEDAMNSWSLNVHSDMTASRYGYFPTVAWVPERCWLVPGQYPDAGVIDALADDFLAHGVQAIVLDDNVHCIGYDSHQIHQLAGSTLKIIPRDETFTGRLHAGDGAGALAVLTGLAGSGVGEYRIAVYADDWEMAAEIGEWAGSMPQAKETYDWFVWKCHDESAWLHTWKLADAAAHPEFGGVTSMNLTPGTHWSIGGTDGYGGANNAWYTHWAGFVPWVTGGDGNGNCAGAGGSCQDYGAMWVWTYNELVAAPTNAISEAGWYAMMTNLYETGWHDYMGGPISGWEHSHSAHVKNGRYFAAAAHWGAGEWTSPALNAFPSDVDGDGYDELILHNERLLAIVEAAGGRVVHLSARDGDLVDTAVGCDNVYWYGTEADYNDGNHVAALSEVSPDLQSLPFDWTVDAITADSVQVTLAREGFAKTLILRQGEPYLRCVYSAGAGDTYVKSGFSPSLASLIWEPALERVWDPEGAYMGFRNPATGLFAGYVLGGGGATHSTEFSGRLMKGDELRGGHRFEFYLYAASTPAPVGGEIPALETLAAGLADVLPPAALQAVYFSGTDRLRLALDQPVALAGVDPTRVAVDDDGDGVADLILDAATSVPGYGWQARVDLILTPADAATLEGLATASLTLLLEAGAFADASGLANAPLTGADAFPLYYGPPTAVTVDGAIDHAEWGFCQLAVDDPDNDSEWSLLNELQALYLTTDDSYLYLGLEGRVEAFNGWVIHLDVDYGAGTGESDLSDLPSWDKNAVFTYPGVGIDYLYGSWGGADGNFYSIDGPAAMTDLAGLGAVLASDQGAAWPGSELAIPWDLIYGLGENALPPGAVLGVSAAIAGGVELGGDVLPDNLAASLPVVDTIALILLDADGDGVPDGPDHEAPVLLGAEAASDTAVVLRFSEALDPATAENPVFYRIHETLVPDRLLAIADVALGTGDSLVTVVTEDQDAVSYTVHVFGLRDASCYLNEINPNSTAAFDGPATPAGETPPAALALSPNWPNPFNPTTRLAFDLAQPGQVILTVHDLAGRRVARLADGRFPAGRHVVVWHGRDERGRPVASGVYLALLQSEEGRRTRKMLLLK